MNQSHRLGCNPSIIAIVLLALCLIACSPKYDWRDVAGQRAPYTILMPDKPSRLSREIQLGQQTVTMHMTATQIDGIKFAVGAIKMPDAVKAQAAMALIKSALLKNIEGTISQEKISAANVSGKLSLSEEFNAFNPRTSIRMSGRIVARDGWVFEVLVVGPEHAIDRDIVDMFFSSFKPGNLSDLGSAAAKTPERSIFHRLFWSIS